MRVLHVPTVPWELTEGIARSVYELASAQCDLDVMLAADRDPNAPSVFHATRVVKGWAPTAMLRRDFARAVRELRPDVVHVHGGDVALALTWTPALRDVSIVASCYRTAALPAGMPRRVRELRETRSNVSPRRAIIARLGANALGRLALRTGRIGALCTADPAIVRQFDGGPVVQVQGAARVTPRAARWNDEPVVVFAGRPHVGRGIEDLVVAFRILRERMPRARLRLLLLPGPAAEAWKTQLAGEARIEVTTTPAALAEEFAAAQVGVFPFRWSATLVPALTAAEAMAAGLPIVATAVDCLTPLMQDGVNGYLVAPNEPTALGEAIGRVLEGPAAWQPLAEGARKTVEENWSWEGAAAAARDAYEIALRRKS
jgi:glycosyltransferase involved in cell wall biosynthesis